MAPKHKILLSLCAFLLLSPGISMTLRSVLASDDTTRYDSSTFDTSALDAITAARPLVYTMTIDGAIGTVTSERIQDAIEISTEDKAVLLVIFLDTPGGFTNATREINKSILNSPVPVCIYVAPPGARAGSAGVYMTYAAHFAAMAPSTNIGAAHPVGGGGEEIDSVMNEKVTNDAVAQIRAAAEKRGRNVDWAEQAVRESVSITDSVALAMNVIDFRAKDIDDLLNQIDGRTTDTPDGDKTLEVKNAVTKELQMTFVQKILRIITSPDVAFILFSMGSLGIVLELYNPGAILPGVVGTISLILAFYAFNTLPINYAGLALIILGILFFIAEVKIMSHGLLTMGGLIAMFLGGLMLVDTVDPNLGVSLSVLISVVACVAVAVIAAGYLVIKAAKRQPFIGQEGMVGKVAVVRSGGLVYVDGALWKAEGVESFGEGTKVTIVGLDGMVLKIKQTDS